MAKMMQLYKTITASEGIKLDQMIALAMFACLSGQRQCSQPSADWPHYFRTLPGACDDLADVRSLPCSRE